MNEKKETKDSRKEDDVNCVEAGDEYVKASDARTMLGCNGVIMARLIREGVLKTRPDPLDKRIKQIRIDEIEKLKRKSIATPSRAGEAKRAGHASVARKEAE